MNPNKYHAFPLASKESIPFIERVLEFLLFRFRWIFVICFILPASLLYETYFFIRNWLIFKLKSAPKAHDKKVAVIQKQIRQWNKDGRQKKLCTARAGYMTMCFRFPLYKKHMLGVKTDQLMDILEINKSALTVRVEPMVTMGQLTRFLIPLGYILPIVPELDDLTVGGMINGCGVESSGKKYGLFQHICLSYELVTANGELVVANKQADNEHQSLFYGIPWSHGSLGFLVAATLRIIPCQKYVRLTFYPCFTLREMGQKIRDESSLTENEFVEGIQFSKSEGVVMTGYFVDEIPKNAVYNPIGQFYKPWFFKHVESFLAVKKKAVEYIPLRDYYHRHSKSIFWEIQDLIPFGNHFLFRYLLGWAIPPKISLLKLTMPRPIKNLYDRHHVLQDLLLPADQLEESIRMLDSEVAIYPLWLCPFNLPSQPGLIRNKSGLNKMYVDIGVYGNCSLAKYDPTQTTKKLEKYVRESQGFQMLYADCYMSCAEFWEMFDASLYDWLRAKYDCKSAFPSVYEKVCRRARD